MKKFTLLLAMMLASLPLLGVTKSLVMVNQTFVGNGTSTWITISSGSGSPYAGMSYLNLQFQPTQGSNLSNCYVAVDTDTGGYGAGIPAQACLVGGYVLAGPVSGGSVRVNVQFGGSGSLSVILNGSSVTFYPSTVGSVTFPVTVAGTTTSGGVPYFSSATQLASSSVLTAGDFVLGGGAGSAPTASFSIVPTANGGTGVNNTANLTLGTSNQNWATLGTGIVKNTTTTGALSDAASSDVIGLWTGTCSSSTFLRGDGACAASTGGANTALSNLAAVSINISLLAQTTTDLGSTSNPFRNLYLYGGGTYGTDSFEITGTSTANRTVTFPDNTGTVAELNASQNWTASQILAGHLITGQATKTSSYTGNSTADSGELIVMNCSSSCTYTFNGAPGNGYYGWVESIGSTIATVSLNSLTFNGASSVPVLISDQPMFFQSDGANYFGNAPLVAGTSVSLTPASNGLTIGVSSAGITATQLAAQYSKGSCSEVWVGSGTSSALQSGDDAVSNNTCYNDSGVTRTITVVKCRSDNGSNTTTVNPTFGSAGTGTTILSGALTCGNSYAYSATGTVSNASWTTGSGIDPAMGGTLTGTSIAMIVEYTY
jgi:hypothetical protein